MPRPRAAAVLFSEMVKAPHCALTDERFWTESLCRRWLGRVDDLALEDPNLARGAAILGVRLALRTVWRCSRRGIRHRCMLALSLAVLGSTYRASGRLRRAQHWLDKAAGLRGQCRDQDIHAEIEIRTAYLRLYQGRCQAGELSSEAVRLAAAAMGKARRPLTVVRALNARGTALVYSGEHRRAAEDARAALDRIDAIKNPFTFSASLSLLIFALIEEADVDELEEAKCHLFTLKTRLPHRMPAVRGRLLWAEALLLIQDRNQKAAARRKLDQARAHFVRLGLKAEAAAVTAEIARLKPEGAIPKLAEDLLRLFDCGPVRDLAETLRTAKVSRRAEIAAKLRERVSGPGVLPVAVFPSP